RRVIDQTMADPKGTSFIHEAMPLCKTLGVVAESIGAEAVVLAMEWQEGLCTSAGLLHGGVLMALADSAGGACAHLNLPEGATGTTTIESKTNFLRAVSTGQVKATSHPLHVGRTVIVVDTDVHDDQERLVARVTQSQLVLA